MMIKTLTRAAKTPSSSCQEFPRFWLFLVAMAFFLFPVEAWAETTYYDNLPPCGDTVFAKSLNDSVDTAKLNSSAAQTKQMEETIKAQSDPDKTPEEGYRGHFLSRYCIDFIQTIQQFYEKLRKLLTLTGLKEFIVGLITEIVVAFLNKVCQYLVEGLEAVLEMICIPLPDINLPSLELPGIDGQSCDGISLGDYLKVVPAEPFSTEGFVDKKTFSHPLYRSVKGATGSIFNF